MQKKNFFPSEKKKTPKNVSSLGQFFKKIRKKDYKSFAINICRNCSLALIFVENEYTKASNIVAQNQTRTHLKKDFFFLSFSLKQLNRE